MNNTRNKDIREAAKAAGVCYWQIAEEIGISDCYMSVKLRRELPDKEKERIFAAIEKLSTAEREGE